MKYYRLMSSLPVLPGEPGAPPIGLGELVEQLGGELEGRGWLAVEAVLTSIDVANLANLMAGLGDLFDPRGLHGRDEFTARTCVDMPGFLQELIRSWEESGASPGQHEVWKAYYRYLAEVAEATGSRVLAEWLDWEVPLRNQLATVRADSMGRDASHELITDPAGGANHDDLVARFREEPDPLARQRLIDRARLQVIEELSGIDPFSLDAVIAYLLAVLVLDRWDLPERVEVEKLLEVSE